MLRIRDYDPSRDSHVLRACFVDLQDFERRLDLRIPPGEQIADSYLDLMFQRCREFEGVVLVADVDRVMVGFVTILTRYCSSEPDDDPRAHGFVTDLVVLAAHRGAMSEMWPAVLSTRIPGSIGLLEQPYQSSLSELQTPLEVSGRLTRGHS